MKKTLVLVIVLFFTFSCNNNNSDSNNVVNSDNQQENENLDFKILSFSDSEIPNNLYSGTITTGKKWQDKAGINYFFISEKTVSRDTDSETISTYKINGYHYIKSNGEFKLIREIKDYINECDAILDCGLMENSLELTDINDDNYGEISFVYYMYCAMDLSPSAMKLMLLENGEKYPIRGSSYIQMGQNSRMGGKTNIDPAYNTAPDGFKDFAERKWKKYQDIKSKKQ